MCTFTLLYEDGSKMSCEHVKYAKQAFSNEVSVPENKLATHAFILSKDLWLFTETGSFCADHSGLRCIQVTTE